MVILLANRAAPAETAGELPLEWRAGAGTKSMLRLGLAAIPAAFSVALKLDIGWGCRLQTDFTYHVVEGLARPGLGVGVAIPVVGKEAREGFRLKVPIIAEIGFVFGSAYAGDGYNDTIKWFLIGPSAGLDFTWWFAKKAGVWLCLSVGYMLHADMGSEYTEGYSQNDDTNGIGEAMGLIGAAF